MGAKPLPAQTLARLRSLGQLYDIGVEEGEGGAQTCKMCGSVLKDRAAQVSSVPAVRRSFKPHLVKPRSGGTAAAGPLSLQGGEGGGGGGGGGRGGGGGQKRRLQLEFDQSHEDQLLNRIISLIEPGGTCSDSKFSRTCDLHFKAGFLYMKLCGHLKICLQNKKTVQLILGD